jgi:hypothetical protein
LVEERKIDVIKSFLIPDDDPLIGWDRLQKDKVGFRSSNTVKQKCVPLVEKYFYQSTSKFEKNVDVKFLGKMDLEEGCVVISNPQQHQQHQSKAWIRM